VKWKCVAEGPGDDNSRKKALLRYCVEYVDCHPGPGEIGNVSQRGQAMITVKKVL